MTFVALTECAGCQQLEEELVSNKSEVLRLNSAFDSAKDANALLQHQLKETESKYSLDMSSKDVEIQLLTTEVEKKSNAIAAITQQYHQLRAKYHQELESLVRSNVCMQCYQNSCNSETDSTSDTNELQKAQYEFHGLRLTPNPPHITRRQAPPAMIQRRNFRRATSSPVPCDVSNVMNTESSGSTHAIPTPPISPKPLSYSSSPPQLRRASRPLRKPRQAESATGDYSKRTVKPLYKNDSSEQGWRVGTPLEPVKRQKSGIAPSDINDIIQSNKKSEHTFVKRSPPVLPPIESSQNFTLSSSSFQATPSTGAQKQHRRFVLSKAQGLSSAPVRPMRVLCYNQARLDTAMEVAKDDKVISDGLVEDSTWTELHQQSTTDS